MPRLSIADLHSQAFETPSLTPRCISKTQTLSAEASNFLIIIFKSLLSLLWTLSKKKDSSLQTSVKHLHENLCTDPLRVTDTATGAAPQGKSHMSLKELHFLIFIYILIYLEVGLCILRSLSKSVEPCAVSTMAAGEAAQGWFRIHTQFRIWGSNAPHNEIHLLRKLALLKKKHSVESQGTSKAP